MEGDESLARVQLIVRDHDRKKFETRKDFLRRTADYLNTVWGAGSFELTVRDSYYNMKEKILPHMDLIENAQAAMRAADVAPAHRRHPRRHGRRASELGGSALPEPLHRRSELPQHPRVYPRRIAAENDAGGSLHSPARKSGESPSCIYPVFFI